MCQTTYSYNKTWSQALIDSGVFRYPQGHQNPASMPYSSTAIVASDIHIGSFDLSPAFVSQINRFDSCNLSQQNLKAMSPQLQQAFKLNGNEFFYGNPSDPQIGNIRVKFKAVTPLEISVIGKQNDNIIDTFYAKLGKIELLNYGNIGAQQMFDIAAKHNTELTWALRLGGLVMMCMGLLMILGPINAVADRFSFTGAIFGAGTLILSVIVSIVLSLLTISIAWLYYRPVIGFSLIAIAITSSLGGFKFIRNKISKNKLNQKTEGFQGTPANELPQPSPTPNNGTKTRW